MKSGSVRERRCAAVRRRIKMKEEKKKGIFKMSSAKHFQCKLIPAKLSQIAGGRSGEWLAAPASKFHHTNPAKCPHVRHRASTTTLFAILHYRYRGSAKSLEGERWIIAQVLFSYCLDATSNTEQLLSAVDVTNCCMQRSWKKVWVLLNFLYAHLRHSPEFGP